MLQPYNVWQWLTLRFDGGSGSGQCSANAVEEQPNVWPGYGGDSLVHFGLWVLTTFLVSVSRTRAKYRQWHDDRFVQEAFMCCRCERYFAVEAHALTDVQSIVEPTERLEPTQRELAAHQPTQQREDARRAPNLNGKLAEDGPSNPQAVVMRAANQGMRLARGPRAASSPVRPSQTQPSHDRDRVAKR